MPETNVTKIGLTGNIASGKSTILELFKKHGCHIISTDKIGHELLLREDIKKFIVEEFGKRVLEKDGVISRRKLSKIVFKNRDLLKQLELILHPEIEKIVKAELASIPDDKKAVIEIPLLFEAGWDSEMDYNVLISCPREVRKSRCRRDDFDIREAAQWPEEKKAKLATHIIDNSKDFANTEKQVIEFIQNIDTGPVAS